jgi:allantoicase
VDIDNNHFLGNHPPHASIDAVYIQKTKKIKWVKLEWKEILPKSSLLPGSQNFYEIKDKSIYTHLRLNIYPDGGVARLKVYGEVFKDWKIVDEKEEVDLAAAINGAKAILCNDMFFSHMDNLIMPGRGINMGDGWETKRNRIPGNRDWVIVRLAHEGFVDKITIDTNHFKGNYPDSFLVEGCNIPIENEHMVDSSEIKWTTILPQSKLKGDQKHSFKKEIESKEAFTHVRLSIFPDGGISRMRVWGIIKK